MSDYLDYWKNGPPIKLPPDHPGFECKMPVIVAPATVAPDCKPTAIPYAEFVAICRDRCRPRDADAELDRLLDEERKQA